MIIDQIENTFEKQYILVKLIGLLESKTLKIYKYCMLCMLFKKDFKTYYPDNVMLAKY